MTPGASSRCHGCAFEVPAGAERCPNCGAPQGELEPCPHCGAKTGTSPHAEFRWVCDVCGGPRVPHADRSIKLSGREKPLLRKADAARKARALWRGGAIASGLLLPFVALFFAVLMIALGAKLGLVLMALVAIAPVLGFLAYAASRAGARGREIGPAIDAAWMAAATDVAQQTRGPVSASDLGRKLGLEEPQAEELMALLDVNEAIAPRPRIAVEPPRVGQPPVSMGDPPKPPVSTAPVSAVGPTQIASAEDEAAAIEASAAEEAQQRKGSA